MMKSARSSTPTSKHLAPFTKRVLFVIRKIPRGRVATYAGVARAAGSPRAFRAVGNALRINPEPVTVPCHRVVGSDGTIGGYTGGLPRKRALLRKEGVSIVADRIDLERYGVWIP